MSVQIIGARVGLQEDEEDRRAAGDHFSGGVRAKIGLTSAMLRRPGVERVKIVGRRQM